MVSGAGRRREQTLREVASYGWLSESDIGSAGCLSVATGPETVTVAQAFGIDLDGELVIDPTWRHVASLQVRDSATVVVEDNGFEGSREVVLRAASRGGKAASLFWNVNGLVVVSFASRGKVTFSAPLDDLEDPDGRDGLPRGLDRFAVMVGEDDADLLAIGAAMVSTFTGVAFGPEVVDGRWRELEPVVQPIPTLDLKSSGLRWSHPTLLDAIAVMPPASRRPLADELTKHAAARASLTEDATVVEALARLGVEPPAPPSPRLEAMARLAARRCDQYTHALNSSDEEDWLAAEMDEVNRLLWTTSALRFVTSADDLTALLGVVDASVILHGIDGLEAEYVATLVAVAGASPERWTSLLDQVASPPTAAERAMLLRAERREREQAELDAEARVERSEWNGVQPTERIRRARGGAMNLAHTDPQLLVELDRRGDGELRRIAVWSARRLLQDTGLADRPWLAPHVADLDRPWADLDPDASYRLGSELFEALDADPGAPWSTHPDDQGRHVSEQHHALPVVWLVRDPEPLAAAAGVLACVVSALGPAAAVVLREMRAQFPE